MKISNISIFSLLFFILFFSSSCQENRTINIPFDQNAIIMTMPNGSNSSQKVGLFIDPNIKSGSTVRIPKDQQPIVLAWDPNQKTVYFRHESLPSRFGFNVTANLSWTASLVDEAIPSLFLSGLLDGLTEVSEKDGAIWYTLTEDYAESVVKSMTDTLSRFAMSRAVEGYSPDSLRLITLISSEYENIFRELLEKESPAYLQALGEVVASDAIHKYSDYIVFDRVTLGSLNTDSGISALVQKRSSLQDNIADELSVYREISADSTKLLSEKMQKLSEEIQERSGKLSKMDSLRADIVQRLKDPNLKIFVLSDSRAIDINLGEEKKN